jgi:peptidoglycan/xylan/chitin deacetylase (PgdA/CDA1 family)
MTWLVRASRKAVRMMQPLVPCDSRGVTILAYHLVGAHTQSPVDLPIEIFQSQLSELAEFARVVPLAEAMCHLERGAESVRPVVVMTFDDGFDNFRTHAWPLMRSLGMPCTFYVSAGFIDGTSGTPLRGAERLKPIDAAALRDLASERLLTVGSHSWCHGDMRALTLEQLRMDLRRSREYLEDCTRKPIEHFCYPRAKWSRRVETEVGAVYRTAAIAGGRQNLAGRFHPLRLSRIPVRCDMPGRLAPIVQASVWLEEWAASHARALA